MIIKTQHFSNFSQIFESGNFTKKTTIIKARQIGNEETSPFAPAPIDEIITKILSTK